MQTEIWTAVINAGPNVCMHPQPVGPAQGGAGASDLFEAPAARRLRRLPDGVGTSGVFAEGPQIPCILTYFALGAHALPHFATFCPDFLWKVTRGNRGTSATTPFVLAPSGSFQGLWTRSARRKGPAIDEQLGEGLSWAWAWVPMSVKRTLLSGKPSPCNPAAETALQPLMWCSESLSSHGSSHPEEFFFADVGMNVTTNLPEVFPTEVFQGPSFRGVHVFVLLGFSLPVPSASALRLWVFSLPALLLRQTPTDKLEACLSCADRSLDGRISARGMSLRKTTASAAGGLRHERRRPRRASPRTEDPVDERQRPGIERLVTAIFLHDILEISIESVEKS